MKILTEKAANQILDLVGVERARWNGIFVKLTVGQYEGRTAIIDGVIPDVQHGLLFCCMVLRLDNPKQVLNTDGESRSYRPLDHFEILD